MEAAAGVLPPRLLPLGRLPLVVLAGPPLGVVALAVRVGHEVDVAVRVALETHQHHAWRQKNAVKAPAFSCIVGWPIKDLS